MLGLMYTKRHLLVLSLLLIWGWRQMLGFAPGVCFYPVSYAVISTNSNRVPLEVILPHIAA